MNRRGIIAQRGWGETAGEDAGATAACPDFPLN